MELTPATAPDATVTFSSIINIHPDLEASAHNQEQWDYLKDVLVGLREGSGQADKNMVVFILHGYGSNGIELRSSLFNWVGKIRLNLPFRVKVILINWDGALSTDSQAWLSANWAQRMTRSMLETSVARSRQIGDKVVEVLKASGFPGVVGVIGHSMGTHAAAKIIKGHTRVTFAMLLNPHLYNTDYDFTLKSKGRLLVAINEGDKVLRGSRWHLDRSLGDLQAHPLYGFFDTSQQLKHLSKSMTYVVGKDSAAIYDTDLRHGIYKHPMMRLNVIHLIRGGSFPPGIMMRGSFEFRPSMESHCTHELKFVELKPWERMALDCYLITLRDYYQHHCLGLHLHTEDDLGNRDPRPQPGAVPAVWRASKALTNAMPVELQQFDGFDWDAINVELPLLAHPDVSFLT